MLTDDDTCRCGVICTCGGDDWGEEHDDPAWDLSAAWSWGDDDD